MRDDLYALTPEAVAALANLGLVKRAQREIGEGRGPKLDEQADGTVVGTFDDGTTTRLVPRKVLRDCPCTCPASGVCRHRVATALAYRAFVDGAGAAAPPPPPVVSWSPGTLGDDALTALLGPRTLAEARSAVERGVVAEIVPVEGTEPPTVRLPTCTVRFLVPHDASYARCDCAIGLKCAHVAVAVWAFRAATPGARIVEVPGKRGAAAKRAVDPEALALALEIVETGVAGTREALAQRFALVRGRLEKDGMTWLATGLEDLETALERYRARSARYRASDVLGLVAEIHARARAAAADGAELPTGAILGQGEPLETKLDHVRLVGLGCRIEGDERERSVEILFADPDTATVLVLERSWTFAAGDELPDGPELGRRRIASHAVANLAAGQLVTRAAKRRANRALVLGQSALGASSVTPQSGDFDFVPPPLRVESVTELARALAARPPKMLRPRVRAEGVHLVRATAVPEQAFDPIEQTLTAIALDGAGVPFVVRRAHRRAAPRALDALGHVLSGGHGAVRWIVGPVHREGTRIVVEPTLVAADRIVVPDVEDTKPIDLPRGKAIVRRDAVGAALDPVEALLEEIVQLGLLGLPGSHAGRTKHAIARLRGLGLIELARRLERVEQAVTAARTGGPDTRRVAATAVVDAAIRLELVRAAVPAEPASVSTPPPPIG